MNMSKLRRALERGNKVVLFDKVRDSLRPGSRILYESYAVFAKFEDLQESWKYKWKLNLQRWSPLGVKAVIVPDLDHLPGEAAARHELAGGVRSALVWLSHAWITEYFLSSDCRRGRRAPKTILATDPQRRPRLTVCHKRAGRGPTRLASLAGYT